MFSAWMSLVQPSDTSDIETGSSHLAKTKWKDDNGMVDDPVAYKLDNRVSRQEGGLREWRFPFLNDVLKKESK
eukprot:scaffold3450_cov114-Cylindrotheca_fusiformis.AAC.4